MIGLPVRWRGAARSALALAALPPVAIGLFLPTKGPGAGDGRDILGGAEIAVAAANRAGGVAGRHLRIVTAPSDLPWEAASGALVRLIYGQGAVAIVGAPDGRSAHLAEQVIARARGQAVFITPWAGDPALTRIRIPWFFRVVPDDRQQAELLAGEIFSARRAGRAAVWVEDSFDARAASAAFVEASPPRAAVLFPAVEPGAREALITRARGGEFGAVVLYAGARGAGEVAAALRRAGCRSLIAGPLRLATADFMRRQEAEGALLVAPGGGDPRAERDFEETFRSARGASPSPLAFYSHDAVRLLIEAMRRAAPAPGSLGPALESTWVAGLTGRVSFDDHRNRLGAPGLAVVRNGRPVPLDRGAARGGRR